jgi:hypothetical protein
MTVQLDHKTSDLLVARLAAAFPDVGADAVRAAVGDALLELADARLHHFVPLLVEKRAREACRLLRQQGLSLRNAVVQAQ